MQLFGPAAGRQRFQTDRNFPYLNRSKQKKQGASRSVGSHSVGDFVNVTALDFHPCAKVTKAKVRTENASNTSLLWLR